MLQPIRHIRHIPVWVYSDPANSSAHSAGQGLSWARHTGPRDPAGAGPCLSTGIDCLCPAQASHNTVSSLTLLRTTIPSQPQLTLKGEKEANVFHEGDIRLTAIEQGML